MKKLMIVAAAALGMTAFADIESVNVVGYVETPLQGYKMLTPAFENLGTSEYPIDNFVVKGASDGTCTIQTLDANGQSSGVYYWYNEYEGLPAGWFDALGVEPANITLKPGEGVFFYTSQSGVSVVSAGQVSGAVTFEVAGYKMAGNASPVTIPVDKMSVNNAIDGTCTIQTLNSSGQSTGVYYWYNEYEGLPAGWFDALGVESANFDLDAGDVVFFYTSQSGVSATVPSAIE